MGLRPECGKNCCALSPRRPHPGSEWTMSNAKPVKWIKRSLAAISALILLSSFAVVPPALAQSSDNTILICTHPGSDAGEARKTLTDKGCKIIREIKCVAGKFSIFHVQPNGVSASSLISSINGTVDPNIMSAEITFQSKCQWSFWPKPSCTPNDPAYPSQYNLPSMNWNDARCTLRLLGINQRAQPRVTLLDSGVNPITNNNEMTDIQQFSFINGANGTPETPFDAGFHGTAVSGCMAGRTNNSTLIAGTASHNLPVKVTCCRVSSDGTFLNTTDAIAAMTWCVDNQALRGGPGVINLSINSSSGPTYNASPVIQEIARAARAQGDLFVNGSGNSGLEDPSPELNLRRVGGLDENNVRASFSNFGPFQAYTNAVNILTYNLSFPSSLGFATGTSFACPQWAAVISLLQSISPRLNAAKADKIVFATADRTPDGNRIPNVNTAVIFAILFGWF